MSECIIKEKERNTKPGEFLSRKVGYVNLSLEKPVPGYIPHLLDNTFALLGSGGTVGPLAQLQKCVWALLLSKQVWKYFHFHFHPVARDCQQVRESQGSLQESPVNTYRCPGLAESLVQFLCPTSLVQFLCPTPSPLARCLCGTSHAPDGTRPKQGNCSRHRCCTAISSPYTVPLKLCFERSSPY